MRLAGKTAIITGGSRGIGGAIATDFAQNGANLVLVALHEKGLKKKQAELQNYDANVITLCSDISDPDTATTASNLTLDTFGPPDILVNCAGIITRTLSEDLSIDDWNHVINVNLSGSFYLAKAVLPLMRKQNYGKIINITSQMAWMPHPSASPSYEASKAGMTALTRHLALHYAKYNICVNAIAPGSIDTDLPRSMSEEARQKLKNAVPLQRLGEPHEVGKLATFLASEDSNYITGATINVTGGSLMD